MKQTNLLFTMKSFFLMLFFSLFSLAVWAQEEQGSGGAGGSSGGESTTTTTTTKKTSINISSNDGAGDTWYTSPWVWIVGAAVFILLLVALLSNRGRDTVTTSDRVKVTRTVERDGSSDV